RVDRTKKVLVLAEMLLLFLIFSSFVIFLITKDVFCLGVLAEMSRETDIDITPFIKTIMSGEKKTISSGMELLYNNAYSKIWLLALLYGNRYKVAVLLAMILILVIANVMLINKTTKQCEKSEDAIVDYLRRNDTTDISLVPYNIRCAVNEQHDVYQRLKDEKEKELTYQQDFWANVTHQIKTPLSVLQIRLEKMNDEENVRRCLDNVTQIDHLLEDSLTLCYLNSSLPKMELKKVNMTSIIESIVDELGPAMEIKDLHVNVCAPEAMNINCDERWISEALSNILKNCIEHAVRGTEIRFNVVAEKNGVRVAIGNINSSDVFISENEFQRYNSFSVDRSSNSHGLGLAIAKRILELHYGNISVNSVKEYVEFNIWIPYLDAAGMLYESP
ncbi:MAG: HAMP domain-containing histidine kinase, partial [Oscillospiraceae bacterium]|nr:HAMP domain-containing histidine kinase [Oscillospiraceae bacterium]